MGIRSRTRSSVIGDHENKGCDGVKMFCVTTSGSPGSDVLACEVLGILNGVRLCINLFSTNRV